MSDVGTVIAAGANLIGNVMTNQINAERAASDMIQYYNLLMKQRQWQKEDYNWTEGYSKRMLDYQNAYNSPSAQMQRYREAGLNPFLMMQNGQVGSGNSQSVPNAPLPSRTGVTPFQRPELGNLMEGVADKLYGASQLKSQRIVALSEMAKSIPSLVKGLGSEPAKRLLSSLFGRDVDTKLQDEFINIELGRQRIAQDRESLEKEIVNLYGADKAALINQNLVFEGQKVVAEINELYSQKKLNEASVKELLTRSAKNVAESAHLNADSETINQLRPFVVKSANMKADMDGYDKIEMQADFMQREYARDWQRSNEGKAAATAAQTVSDNPETNLVNKIIHAKDPSRRGRR